MSQLKPLSQFCTKAINSDQMFVIASKVTAGYLGIAQVIGTGKQFSLYLATAFLCWYKKSIGLLVRGEKKPSLFIFL